MDYLGYEFLRQSLGLSAFPPERPAVLKPVTRIVAEESFLAVPRHAAPRSQDPLEHALFALKHEGTNLQILAEAAPRINPSSLVKELRRVPSGTYIRTACFLWEYFNRKELQDLPATAGVPAVVFDPQRYVTGPVRRVPRWRLHFNGLGTIRYCVTVERTPQLLRAIDSDVLGRTKAFVESLAPQMMDRTLSWAYLHETEDSYAIEREAPTEDKARAFVKLLQQAHERRSVTEDYLIELQNSAVSNPFSKAVRFRDQQNWLRGPARGPAGVTYVPPPPDLVPELMDDLMDFANAAPHYVDPIVAASVISFGFVYIHPFMDGNGRLARFLFHQALCQSGRLERGLLLPVSAAMKRSEAEYLAALQQFSRPARERWTVRQTGEGRYAASFNGDPAMYRYWDATKCAEFGHRMAEQALDVELRRETEFLARYDAIFRAVNDRYDIQNSDLTTLILACLRNEGVVSKHRRKQFAHRVPEEAFDFIEQTARQTRSQGADV